MTPARARAEIRSKQKRRFSTMVAACMAIAVIAVAARLPVFLRSSHLGTDTLAPTPQDTVSSSDVNQAPSTLESLLLSVDTAKQEITDGTLPLHRDNAQLIWQYEGELEYNAYTIRSDAVLTRLIRELDTPSLELSAEDSDDITVKVWIAFPDGRVVSPYLKHTRGNTSLGALFDYSAEVEPSKKLTQTLYELLK